MSATARAVIVEAAGHSPVVEDIDVADPVGDEVRVRLAVAGICHTDLSCANGTLPSPLPAVLGHEGAGIVEAVGPAVTRVARGDRVVISIVHHCGHCRFCETGHSALCVERSQARDRYRRGGVPLVQAFGTGTFAELTVVRERSIVRAPDDVPLDVAAVTGCAVITGAGAVFNIAKVEAGATVAVFGCGGVGASAVMAAGAAGAARIVVVDPNGERRGLALSLGATDAAPPDAEVLRELAPDGLDYVFESAGRVDAMELAVETTGRGGTTVLMGLPGIEERVSISPFSFLVGEKRLLGCNMGSVRPAVDFDRYFALYRRGRMPLDALVSAHVPMEEAAEGFAAAERGAGLRVMLDMSADQAAVR